MDSCSLTFLCLACPLCSVAWISNGIREYRSGSKLRLLRATDGREPVECLNLSSLPAVQ